MHGTVAHEDPNGIRRKVIETALEHHLVSKYTSLVAVDVTPSRPVDAPLASGKLPHNLPHGWDFDKVFGEAQGPSPAPAPQQDAALSQPTLASAEADQQIGVGVGIALPQGATPAPLQAVIGVILMVLALLMFSLRRSRGA